MSDEPRSGVRPREIRARAYLDAVAIFDDGRSTLQCQIRNLTQEGAKLTMPSTLALPETFMLEVATRGERRAARVRWRTATEAGVSFTQPDRRA